MKWVYRAAILFVMCNICFYVGRNTGHKDCAKEVEEAQKAVEMCEAYKKLDASLFFDDICQSVCEEKFEQMGC